MANEIAAVILAAGGSTRFGQPKQLVQFRGKSLLRRIIDAANEASCDPIMVVIGGDREETTNELAKTPATAIENKNWQRGIGTSIRIGVQSAIDKIGTVDKEGRFPKRPTAVGKPPLLGAIVLLTCDQPFVDGKVIKQLITLREKTKNTIVASSYSGTLGVPALFDHSCFPELLALDDKSGAKAIILSNPERVAEFAFPEGRIDIDTTEDLERLKETGSSRME